MKRVLGRVGVKNDAIALTKQYTRDCLSLEIMCYYYFTELTNFKAFLLLEKKNTVHFARFLIEPFFRFSIFFPLHTVLCGNSRVVVFRGDQKKWPNNLYFEMKTTFMIMLEHFVLYSILTISLATSLLFHVDTKFYASLKTVSVSMEHECA